MFFLIRLNVLITLGTPNSKRNALSLFFYCVNVVLNDHAQNHHLADNTLGLNVTESDKILIIKI